MRQSLYYTTNNVIITMGDDFHYQNAHMWFENMDKLIRYVNTAEDSLNVFYSTPACYIKAVNDFGTTYTAKMDDFFPYASDSNSYWTGYYTSRPTIKYFERLGNNFLQVTKQLEAMTQLGQTKESPMDSLREAMGVMQHHDAITGTEKQHVANDYMKILSSAIENARKSAQKSLNKLIATGKPTNVVFDHCLELNVSMCDVTEEEDLFVLTVYNPLSRKTTHMVRFPVQEATYNVRDFDGFEQKIQMVPIPEQVRKLPERQNHPATHDLLFRAVNLPPLGFRSYYVSRVSPRFQKAECTTSFAIENAHLTVYLNETTGLINKIGYKEFELPFNQSFYYYEAFAGSNDLPEVRSSGAYVFRPRNSTAKIIANKANVKVYKGNIVQEIHQTFSSWVSQVIRIYNEEDYVEFEWLVGPIPIEDGIGKDVITRYTANFTNKGVFFTDSNGRELLKRIKNFRPTWMLQVQEPISSNYYPVTSRIAIKSIVGEKEVTVVTDRPQGGSSLGEGQIELMVHRRLLRDDGFGVNEELNETAYNQGLVVRGKHSLFFRDNTTCPNMAVIQRQHAQRKAMSPWLFFSPTGIDYVSWKGTYRMEYAGLKHNLPPNMKILTLEPWKEKTLLFRLEHIMEKDEHSKHSQCTSVKVPIEDLFSDFVVKNARKTTLDGNQLLEESTRLEWRANRSYNSEDSETEKDSSNLMLCPMEIESYLLSVQRK